MSEDVLETIRATVQDVLAPEVKMRGVRLESIERRLDDGRRSSERRTGDLQSSLEHRVNHTKDMLLAKIRTLEAKMDGRFAVLDSRLATLEGLIRNLLQQVTVEAGLPERVAALEARMPRQ